MKLSKKLIILGVTSSLSMPLLAGSLDSPAAPTVSGSAMYTIEDIHKRLTDGTAGTKRTGSFTEPASGPTTGTGHTLTDVMDIAPTQDTTDGADPNDVTDGKTYWGLTNGNWGPKTGTAGGCAGTMNGTRWCDNGDGTVKDLSTGLVWLQKADWGGQKQWDSNGNDNAFVRAGTLKDGSTDANLSDGSEEGDWRLPTKKELVGITDPAGTEPVSTGAMGAFTGVQASSYWSSTTYASNAVFAWYVYLDDGYVDYGNKTNTFYVWPVRGGK